MARCMSRRFVWMVASCLVLATLAGCGDDGGTPPPASPTAPATPIPTVVVTFDEVTWATATDDVTGAPFGIVTTLPNSAPRVYASVHADRLPAGAEIQAHWTIDGEPLPELEPRPVVIDAGRADAWISWSLTWTGEQPWPIGTLGIRIEVNGELKAQSEIMITRDRSSNDAG